MSAAPLPVNQSKNFVLNLKGRTKVRPFLFLKRVKLPLTAPASRPVPIWLPPAAAVAFAKVHAQQVTVTRGSPPRGENAADEGPKSTDHIAHGAFKLDRHPGSNCSRA
jgi:hypothetical protein